METGDERRAVVGRVDTSDLDHCPYCGTALAGWECWSCKVAFVYEGDKLVERGLSSRGERPQPERRCIGCDGPLKPSSVLTPAWADGDNPDGYITCADCGSSNVFGS
jgi:hypothetical protein